jgi:Fe-S cluster assembly iron-binding protein IscA
LILGRACPEEGAEVNINLTATAAEKVKGILEQRRRTSPGRFADLRQGGDARLSYGMVLDEAADGDEVLRPPA